MTTFPLCFFDTEDMGKSADDHKSVISDGISRNDKLGDDMLVFSGPSDNEPSVALAVDGISISEFPCVASFTRSLWS